MTETLTPKFIGNNFNEKQEFIETEYILEGVIPKCSTTTILGKSGTGKSLWSSCLLFHIKYNQNYLGLKTIKNIDSLLIDEDTTTDSLMKNMVRLQNAIEKTSTHNEVYFETQKGLNLKDNSLFNKIKEYCDNYPKIKLIVIDSLHGVSKGLNKNDTSAMGLFTEFRQKISEYKKDLTLIVIHHISDKAIYTFEELMNPNISGLGMGSSIINQSIDSSVILVAKTFKGNKLLELGVLPKEKRYVLNTQPFICTLTQNKTELLFKYKEKYTEGEHSDLFQDIILLLKSEGRSKEPKAFGVKEIWKSFEGEYGYGLNNVGYAVRKLRNQKIIRRRRIKPNLFRYELIAKKTKNNITSKKIKVSKSSKVYEEITLKDKEIIKKDEICKDSTITDIEG